MYVNFSIGKNIAKYGAKPKVYNRSVLWGAVLISFVPSYVHLEICKCQLCQWE